MHPDASSRRSTSCRSTALALAVRPVTASRGVTTRHLDCTGSTAPMSCIRTRHLDTRLLVGQLHWLSPCVWSLRLAARLHRSDCTSSTAPMPCIRTRRLAALLLVGRLPWLSSCVRSLRLAARLLVVQIAPALLRLCRASGRAVSMLDFSSVGRTSSRCVPSHSVVRCDYPSHTRNGYTSTTPHVRVPRHVARSDAPFVVNFDYVARPGASARRAARRTARRRILRLRRVFGCLSTSRGSLSTSSLTSRVWVPRHVM
jgi:hypothetical protein